jgi:transcriptional regulator with XRE-family HTH domain
MTIAKRIRDCRYVKGWGPDELAHKAEISRTALYQIECGKTETPRAGTLRRIARALDVPVEKLLGHERGVTEALSEIAAEELFAPPPDDSASYRLPEIADSHTAQQEPLAPPPLADSRSAAILRENEMVYKFKELLASPLGESVGRIVEESYRMLPILQRTS